MKRIFKKLLKRHRKISLANSSSNIICESSGLCHFQSKKHNAKCKLLNISGWKVDKIDQSLRQMSTSKDYVISKILPTKSENDNKQYLVVKLQNGLTALLVSDQDRVFKSATSANKQIKRTLKNDLDNTQENKDNLRDLWAACSLTIGAGSFNDPDEIPGLAHLLEHMLFMGSNKFPNENEFNSFVTTKGGSNNAMTDGEQTTFYFDCMVRYLEETLDRFTSMFIAPLLNRDSMIRERESVDSEFHINATNDELRVSHIITSTATEKSPAGKFLFGNLKTLKENIGEDVLQANLQNFWSTHYSAHRMTLAIQAKMPLESLRSLVVQYFSEIPSNFKPKNTFTNMDSPFDIKSFHKLYTVMPVNNTDILRLTWILPPIQHLYKSKPTLYTTFMINHEGEGSLTSYLRNNLWALNVVAVNGGDDIENNSLYSLFSITILLTENGLSNVDKVLSAVFSYIKLLQRETPDENTWKEIKFMMHTNFQYSPEMQPTDNVLLLSQSMQIYPIEDYITGTQLLSEYNPDKIMDLLNLLTADKVNVVLMSKKAAGLVSLDKVEQWFNSKYNVSDIPAGWIEEWKRSTVNEDISKPTRNPFIPGDFSILPDDKVPSEIPTKLRHDKYMELWFKQDKKFLQPFGYVTMYMISPYSISLPQHFVMCDLFVSLFSIMYNELVYPANVAGLVHNLTTSDYGLLLSITGYNDKMLLFLETILHLIITLKHNVTAGLFEIVKEEQRNSYFNEVLNPSSLAREMRLLVLCEPYCTSITKLDTISAIDLTKFQEFCSNFFENVYVKCLIQGNISQEQSLKMANKLQQILNYKSLLPGCCPQIRVRKLPTGENIIRVKSLNEQDLNGHITNYYQCGLGNHLRESCLVELLMATMMDPLLDTLRTKEQLSYYVYNDIRYTYGVIGFSIAIKFQSDKFNVDFVESRISAFLNGISDVYKNISDETFLSMITWMKMFKGEAETQLADEVNRNWSEIESNEYVFDRLKREINFLDTVQKHDMYNFFTQMLDSNKKYDDETSLRKLSVQVDANYLASSEPLLQDKSQNLKHTVEFIIPSKDKENKFVADINSFRNALYIYPVLKLQL